MHQHLGLEIVLVTRGSCAVHVGAVTLRATTGEAFVLPANKPHNQLDEGTVDTVYANFDLRLGDFPSEPRVLAMPVDGLAAGWLGQLADLQTQPLPPTVRSGLALALIDTLAQGEHHRARQRMLHPGLVKAMQRIESDHLEDLTVNDLARAAELSPSHLTALFRQHVGCAPLAYAQRQRLELAARLLRNAYLSIAEVADACGYADANYFSRLFRQTHHCSPSAWRNQAGAV